MTKQCKVLSLGLMLFFILADTGNSKSLPQVTIPAEQS